MISKPKPKNQKTKKSKNLKTNNQTTKQPNNQTTKKVKNFYFLLLIHITNMLK